jgi:hypothetical protein
MYSMPPWLIIEATRLLIIEVVLVVSPLRGHSLFSTRPPRFIRDAHSPRATRDKRVIPLRGIKTIAAIYIILLVDYPQNQI